MRPESQQTRSKYSHQPMFGVSAQNLKRDPTIEAIIESRKAVVIENAYTQLAKITSQSFRSSHPAANNSLKPRSIKSKSDVQVHFTATIEDLQKMEKEKNFSTLPLDSDQWDDGLNGDYDRGR